MHISESIDFESVELQIAFAKMGMGTALAPRRSMDHDLEKGVLKEVPLSIPVPPRTVWGIYHSPPPIRIETFIKVIGSKENLPNL